MALNPDDIREKASSVADAVSGKASEVAEAAKPIIADVVTKATEAAEVAKPHVDKIVDGLSGLAGEVYTAAKPLAHDLADRAKPVAHQVAERVRPLTEAAQPHVEKAGAVAAGVFVKAVDLIEAKTGVDLDGDGVIGAVKVEEQAPAEQAAIESEAQRRTEIAAEGVVVEMVDEDGTEPVPEVRTEPDPGTPSEA